MDKNLLLVDDHSIVRQGLSLLIKNNINNVHIHQASTISTALDIVKNESIDFLILDINLPDGNGISVVDKIRTSNKDLKILIFSALDEEIYAPRYITSGANGYLNKLASEKEMIIAILKFIETGKYYSDNLKEKIFENFVSKKSMNPIETLSDREIEIARLSIKGLGTAAIAASLDLQQSTVSTYKNRIFENH